MFGDNLRKRRMELSLSQDELAKAVGYSSRSSITKLESGQTAVTLEKLNKLAAVLDIPAEELYGTKHKMRPVLHTTERKRKVVAIIQAGGKSTRNIMNVPNQFITVDEKPVIVYVLEAYQKHPLIDEIVVVCVYGWEKVIDSYVEKYRLSKVKCIITGGETILDSVRLGFMKVRKSLHKNDVIILQEATRPMINETLISRLLSAYEAYGSSVMVKHMNAYLQFIKKGEDSEYLDRDKIYGIESPEIYEAQTLDRLFVKSNKKLRDDGSCCALIFFRNGLKIHFCEHTLNNIKIVKQEDLYIFKVLRTIYL